MSTPTVSETIPYIQKDVRERRVITAESEWRIRTALKFIAENNLNAGSYVDLETWEPARRF